ncbi:MAG TPA: Rieske (2Fe-2S) protein [Acidimicrobiales bacterium]|nr:Rieske (2Fe-2S) protein [Acidimicrobiales bacterium]
MANGRKRGRRPYQVRPQPDHPVQRGEPGPVIDDEHVAQLTAPRSIGELFGGVGGPLLFLRAFLGVTFVFAGLQKLANQNFFSATAPGSFQEQLRGSILTSPLHHLLSPVLPLATLVAVVISLGEVAVGLGTLLGLFGRVAALGGLLLSLSFFLTVSFNDNPYYYGPDIVFLFAWTPFVLAGSGTWSLDALFAQRAARTRAALQTAAIRGGPAARRRAAEFDRRVFLQRLSAAGVVGLTGLALGGFVAAIGRLAHGAQQASGTGTIGGGGTNPGTGSTAPTGNGAASSPSTTVPARPPEGQTPKGTRIGPASDVPVGGAASFTDPAQGVPALVVQVKQGTFHAFSAVCPHAGCQVQFDQQNDIFVCPCHGSTFNGSTGAVESGPAQAGLSPITVNAGSNGQLYVDG